MIVKTKFDIDQEIFLLRDNKIISDKISSIHFNLYSDNSGGIRYRLARPYSGNWEDYKEGDLFESKQKLLDNL